ncbi:hypothetical protein ACWGCW_00580 [Streptomyces sp. NPDC054933]
MNLSEDDVRAMRQQNDLKAFIAQHLRDAKTANAHRRGMVLAHRDLAAKLTAPPLEFPTPEAWTGFVPPATTCTGAINTAPTRAALVAIVAEAERRARHPQRTTEAERTAA